MNSWATEGHTLDTAYVTRAQVIICPKYTEFCIRLDCLPFSMKYDVGGLKGLKAMVTDDVIADLVIGVYHAGPMRKLLQFVNLCSNSTMTNSGDILRIHHDEYRKGLLKGILHIRSFSIMLSGVTHTHREPGWKYIIL
jgi:hypothetical protein